MLWLQQQEYSNFFSFFFWGGQAPHKYIHTYIKTGFVANTQQLAFGRAKTSLRRRHRSAGGCVVFKMCVAYLKKTTEHYIIIHNQCKHQGPPTYRLIKTNVKTSKCKNSQQQQQASKNSKYGTYAILAASLCRSKSNGPGAGRTEVQCSPVGVDAVVGWLLSRAITRCTCFRLSGWRLWRTPEVSWPAQVT